MPQTRSVGSLRDVDFGFAQAPRGLMIRRPGRFLGYASRHGRVPPDRAFCFPEDWTKHRLRRAEAHIPDHVALATESPPTRALLRPARVAGVSCAWVTGDGVYGGN